MLKALKTALLTTTLCSMALSAAYAADEQAAPADSAAMTAAAPAKAHVKKKHHRHHAKKAAVAAPAATADTAAAKPAKKKHHGKKGMKAAMAAPVAAAPAPVASNDFLGALTSGKFSLDARYRYEEVSQDSLQRPAVANTLRTIVGYETGEYHHFKAQLAALNVIHLSNDTYNDGFNGKTAYPSISDPEDLQLFLGNLTYTGVQDTTVIAGRQQLALDQQRWVGAPSWRQISQTYDGVVVKNKSVKDLELMYGFLFHDNRSGGTGVTNGTYDMHTHLMHAAYTGLKDVKLIGYSYLADIKNVPTSSSATYGARVEASHKLSENVALTGNAEYARQVSYANNPNGFGLDYYLVEPGVNVYGVKTKFGYEVLSSDGTAAVQTPLMSSHAMNGWADVFTTTPTNGLQDAYVDVSYSFKLPVSFLGDTKVGAQWHDYNADHGSTHYGNEYDLDLVQNIGKNYAVGIQYENYINDNYTTSDTQKVIVTGQMKF